MHQDDIDNAKNNPIVRSLLTLDALLDEGGLVDDPRDVDAVKKALREASTMNADLDVFLDDKIDLTYYFEKLVDRDMEFDGSLRFENTERFLVALMESDRSRKLRNDKINVLLRGASIIGSVDIVRLLLDYPHVNPSTAHNWPIYWASRKGHLGVVRLLLADQRINFTDFNSMTIHRASNGGYTEVVRLLLADPRVNERLSDNERRRYTQ